MADEQEHEYDHGRDHGRIEEQLETHDNWIIEHRAWHEANDPSIEHAMRWASEASAAADEARRASEEAEQVAALALAAAAEASETAHEAEETAEELADDVDELTDDADDDAPPPDVTNIDDSGGEKAESVETEAEREASGRKRNNRKPYGKR